MRPLRTVETAHLRETSSGARWWDLGLACGHVQERSVKYQPMTGRRGRARRKSAVLPAPKRARCETCPLIEESTNA